jgi:hypothetical protein
MKTLLKNFAIASLSLGTAAISLTAGFAQAATLADLFSGQSLVVGDKVFTGWTLGQNPNLVNLSQIDVTTLTDQPLNPGIKYTVTGDALKVSDTNKIDLSFNYTVSTTSAQTLIKDNSLALTGYSFMGNGGLIAIGESLGPLGSKLVYFDNKNDDQQLTDLVNFPQPQFSLPVSTTIQVNGDFAGDMANVTMFEQRFSQVPEPLTMLGAATAAGFGIFFKRKLNKKKDKDA